MLRWNRYGSWPVSGNVRTMFCGECVDARLAKTVRYQLSRTKKSKVCGFNQNLL